MCIFLHTSYYLYKHILKRKYIYLAMPTACGSSQARDQTCATVAACTIAVAMPDP